MHDGTRGDVSLPASHGPARPPRVRAWASAFADDASGSGAIPTRSERGDLYAAFETERQRIVAERLRAGVAMFLGALFVIDWFEWLTRPERVRVMVPTSAFQVACCLAALAALRWARVRPQRIGLAVFCSVTLALIAYNAVVAGGADRVAIAVVVVLTSYAVVMLPSLAEQLVLVTCCAAGFVAAAPFLVVEDAPVFPVLGVLSGGAASAFAANLLTRFSRASFVRRRLGQEEADIAATLLRVGETLNARLDRPGMLDEMNRLAVEALGCDWSATWVVDDEAKAFRLVASHGMSPERAAALDAWAREGAHGPAAVAEVEDLHGVLFAPMLEAGERIGVFAVGVESPGHRFAARERRLVRGIAQAAAIAIRNTRLLADVQAASRLKSDFVATMSHELRTPVNVVIGYLDMLADEAHGPLTGAQAGLLASARRQALHLLGLVNTTLELNRLESGREPVDRVELALDDLLAEVAREVEALVPPAVSLALRAAADLGPVTTDRAKLKTIVKNLLGNAIKFTKAGTIAVTAVADGDALLLTVADTGVGIAPDDLPVIFESFRQGRAGVATAGGGVGLGLHIVERLVSRLGGTVTVESALGVGTTFVVRLPHVVAAAVPRPA